MRYQFIFSILILNGCGDIASTSTTNSATSATDNSVDNSQTGISSCTDGSSFVCDQTGPHSFTQSQECINVDGTPVVLDGPEPISESLADACPTPEPTPAPEPVVVP